MPDRQVPIDVFVGRAAELARVAEVFARVEAGQPWLVAIVVDDLQQADRKSTEALTFMLRRLSVDPVATATPMATIQRLDPDGRAQRLVEYSLVSQLLVACWLVAGRFAVWD